MFTAALSSLFF